MHIPYFINVDVELISEEDLHPLEDELKEKISILLSERRGGKYALNFECASYKEGGVSGILEQLTSVLSGLSESCSQLLANCESRRLDVGYNSGAEGWVYGKISSELLSKVSELGFDLYISVYGLNAAASGKK